MQKHKLDFYKEFLMKERGRLFQLIKQEETPEDFGSDVDDFTEETDEAEAFSNHAAIAQDLRNRVSEIDAALNRIRENNYGICEQCGALLSDAILSVAPESRLCERCKTKKI